MCEVHSFVVVASNANGGAPAAPERRRRWRGDCNGHARRFGVRQRRRLAERVDRMPPTAPVLRRRQGHSVSQGYSTKPRGDATARGRGRSAEGLGHTGAQAPTLRPVRGRSAAALARRAIAVQSGRRRRRAVERQWRSGASAACSMRWRRRPCSAYWPTETQGAGSFNHGGTAGSAGADVGPDIRRHRERRPNASVTEPALRMAGPGGSR